MALPAAVNAAAFTSNQRLLGAALAGLLCLAPAACTPNDSDSGAGAAGSGDSAGTSSSLGGEAGATPTAGDSGSGGAAGAGAAPVSMGGAGDAAGAGGHDSAAAGTGDSAGMSGSAGVGGAPPELPHITSSKNVGVLTEEDFKALCDERGGTVEVMPHCNGFATAKGFSYDNGTLLLSEHTCAGANTCGGWNCVIDD